MEYLKFTPELANDWKNALSASEPYVLKRVMDSMNQSQLESKLWIIQELIKLDLKLKKIAILGGWYAQYTVPLLIDAFNPIFICNYEIDPDVKKISYKFNKRYKSDDAICIYKCEIHDVMFVPLQYSEFDLVINTSCEHMFSMSRFRRLNKSKDYIYVLQSSDDNQYDDHINCVQSADELAEQANIIDIKYMGSKKLSNGMTRFMVIGR